MNHANGAVTGSVCLLAPHGARANEQAHAPHWPDGADANQWPIGPIRVSWDR